MWVRISRHKEHRLDEKNKSEAPEKMHSNPDILYRISFTRAKVTPARIKAKTG